MRLSLSYLALRIKILKVDLGSSIEDVLSRALDPPSPVNIQRAVSALVEVCLIAVHLLVDTHDLILLLQVGALTPNEEITPLGRLLSALPTDVHIGKFLLMAAIFRCLDPALTIAATLNSKSPFLTPFGHEWEADRAKSSFLRGSHCLNIQTSTNVTTDNSDFLTMHNAFSSWRRASSDGESEQKFCRTNFLSRQVCLSFVRQNITSPSFRRTCNRSKKFGSSFLRKFYANLTCYVTPSSSRYLIDAGLVQADKALVRQLSRYVYISLFSVPALRLHSIQCTVQSISDEIRFVTPGI